MSTDVKPIPDGFHTLTPYLIVQGAREAIAFYEKAFGAEVVYRMAAPDGRVVHGELRIGDSRLFLSEELPEAAGTGRSPAAVGAHTASLMVYTEDTDAAFAKAVDAGATVSQAPTDMFWGDRFARVVDPFGHEWQLATRIEELTSEQIRERAAKAFGPPQG